MRYYILEQRTYKCICRSAKIPYLDSDNEQSWLIGTMSCDATRPTWKFMAGVDGLVWFWVTEMPPQLGGKFDGRVYGCEWCRRI